MRNVFIATSNVNRCTELCVELQDPVSMIGPSLATIAGRAGRGKTEFASYFATNSNAVYIPPMKGRPPGMLLREITFELCKLAPRSMEKCLEVIEKEMSHERRLIFIDEADELPISILEMLRNINERYACPIVLIGEEGLRRKVMSRRRIASRIRRHVEFSAVMPADLALFYKKALGLEISPGVIPILHRHTGGDWRPLLTTAIAIERALNASGLSEISEELAKDITRNGNGF